MAIESPIVMQHASGTASGLKSIRPEFTAAEASLKFEPATVNSGAWDRDGTCVESVNEHITRGNNAIELVKAEVEDGEYSNLCLWKWKN